MKLLLMAWSGLLVLGLSCNLPSGAVTPEEATLRQEHPGPGELVLQLRGRREVPGGVAAILYGGVQPARGNIPAMEIFGYTLVKRGWFGWYPTGGAAGGSPGPAPENLVDFGTSMITDASKTYTIIYGQTLVPAVAAVEVTFDNKQTMRDQTPGGLFILFVSEPVTMCRLRVLDASDQLIREINTRPQMPAGKVPGQPAHSCP